MTDSYAAAWLSEMWPTVREHHEHRPKPIKVSTRRKKTCPICDGEYDASNLSRHINRTHSQAVENVS